MELRSAATASGNVIWGTEPYPSQSHHLRMEPYKIVVLDFLMADKAMFINTECRIQLDADANPKKPGQYLPCDALAIDLRHGSVYLCEIACEHKLQPLLKKLSAWTKNWDSVQTALRRDSLVPANWRVNVWLFVPEDSIEMLDGKLERLRQVIGSKFKVKITALEEVQPWRLSNWERCEAKWERSGRRTLV